MIINTLNKLKTPSITPRRKGKPEFRTRNIVHFFAQCDKSTLDRSRSRPRSKRAKCRTVPYVSRRVRMNEAQDHARPGRDKRTVPPDMSTVGHIARNEIFCDPKMVARQTCAWPRARLRTLRTTTSQWRCSILRIQSARAKAHR